MNLRILMKNLSFILKKDLFKHRYIALNTHHLINSLNSLQNTSYSHMRKRFIKFLHKYNSLYFRTRIACGKIDIPYIELVLTTKCSLRCKACNNLMQYFSSHNQYTTTYKDIQESMDILLRHISSISRIRIIGGEPLLSKELPQVITYLLNQKKIKHVNIVSNGTITFKDDILHALQSPKASVTISDYSSNPALIKKLHHKEILESLKSYNISYEFAFATSDSQWFDPGKIYKRHREKQDIIRNFRSCLMPCVSLIAPNNTIKEQYPDFKGGLFLCPIASSLSQLKGFGEFNQDFVHLNSTSLQYDILNFYAKDFFHVCDYCNNKWEKPLLIPPALQTTKILELNDTPIE